MKEHTLASRAGRALGLNLLNTIVSRVGTFAIGIALARILGPEEFGTFAVALLALTAVLSFNELGVSLAIVRWPGDPREIAPTVTTLCTISSLIFFLATVALAPTFCAAMGAPDAVDVVIVLAFSVVINGLVATPAALLQREFRAGRRMLVDQVMSWLGAFVSIAGALAGWGAMSLGVGRIVGAVAGAALFLSYEPIRFGFDRTIMRRLLRFGLPLAGSSIVLFSVVYVDQFLVGAVIGPVALGFYVLAFNVSNWPVNIFSRPVREVSPAAFARLQGDPPALRSAFLSSVGLLTAITLPVCLVLTGAAGPIVRVVYGPEWAPAAAALGWLGLLAGLRILFELFYDFFVVLGSSRVVFTVQLIWLIALVPALYAGARLGGIAGAAAAHVAVAFAVVLPLYLVELQRANIGWRPLALRVAAPVACGVGAAFVALTASELISLDLLALGVAGAGVLGALALGARRMRATVRQLRTVGAGGVT
jgi:O-antigen/teichoic acid export membrane protein